MSSRFVLALLVLSALLSFARADDSAPAAARDVVAVAGDDVNLRSGPSVDYHDIGKAQRAELLFLVGEDGDWRRVRIPGGPVVYVFASLVDWKEGALRATVRAEDVLMRATPAQAHYPLKDQRLQRGDPLLVLDEVAGDDGRWLRVVAPERVHVWMHGRYLRPAGSVSDLSQRLQELAEQRLDALTGGRLAAERLVEAQKRLEAERSKLEALRARAKSGGAGEELADAASRLAAETADPAVRREAELLAKQTRAALQRVAGEEARRKAEKLRQEEEARRKELEQRDEEYRRRMKELEEQPPSGRGEPAAAGLVAERNGVLVLTVDDRPVLRLVSRRFRLSDYVGRYVRLWGARQQRSGTLDRLSIESLEIVNK